MPRVQELDLTFGALDQIDSGKIALLLKRHLANVAQDCVNRPSDDAKRKVTMEFTFTPVLDPDTRECETVKCQIECKSKVPTFRSKKYEMRVHKTGFAFNRDFPDDLDQPPLFDDSHDPGESPPAKPR